MKHPFWIINSTLLVLLLLVVCFILFSQVTIPEREDIEPPQYSALKREKKIQVNISQIYESDLFGTYQTAQPTAAVDKDAFPKPPEPQVAEIPELPKPQFLDPLDVTLRGIFMVSTDSTKNRSIVADNKTKKEASYKIGDKIGDAQILRIFSDKIILLRSNGQQEVLYLREQDARLDSGYAMIDEWNTVVKPISSDSFMIDPFAFVKRVPDLGQFIEMLHLITAYKKGKSVGVRIGTIDEKSIGTALGLQAGDIITHIDGIPATTIEERLRIYKSILLKHEEDRIAVQLVRSKEPLVFEYLLQELMPEEGQKETPMQQHALKKIEEEEKVKILKQKYEFAPTLQEIRQKERQMMIEKGRAPQEQAPQE